MPFTICDGISFSCLQHHLHAERIEGWDMAKKVAWESKTRNAQVRISSAGASSMASVACVSLFCMRSLSRAALCSAIPSGVRRYSSYSAIRMPSSLAAASILARKRSLREKVLTSVIVWVINCLVDSDRPQWLASVERLTLDGGGWVIVGCENRRLAPEATVAANNVCGCWWLFSTLDG